MEAKQKSRCKASFLFGKIFVIRYQMYTKKWKKTEITTFFRNRDYGSRTSNFKRTVCYLEVYGEEIQKLKTRMTRRVKASSDGCLKTPRSQQHVVVVLMNTNEKNLSLMVEDEKNHTTMWRESLCCVLSLTIRQWFGRHVVRSSTDGAWAQLQVSAIFKIKINYEWMRFSLMS